MRGSRIKVIIESVMKKWNKIHTRIDFRVRSLSPRRISSRFNGPTVIANGIPKSGTHLAVKCLTMFPSLSYSGLHYTAGAVDIKSMKLHLRRTGKGRFMAAHLYWSQECASLLEEKGVKNILIIRDPRDIIVSNIFFTLRKKSLGWHEYFSELPDMDARVRTFIEGLSGDRYLASIRQHFDLYVPWVDRSGSLLVRFEDLIGPNGGGDAAAQRETIAKIARHIGQPLDDGEVERIALNTFSTKSVTFRKGSIGGWKEHFSRENSDLFDKLHGEYFSRFGYLPGKQA